MPFILSREDRISGLLLNGSVFQPFLTALIGPHSELCGICDLNGAVHAGQPAIRLLRGGLMRGAGVGLVVLFRTNHRVKRTLPSSVRCTPAPS